MNNSSISFIDHDQKQYSEITGKNDIMRIKLLLSTKDS
jgi:hypothetical protein